MMLLLFVCVTILLLLFFFDVIIQLFADITVYCFLLPLFILGCYHVFAVTALIPVIIYFLAVFVCFQVNRSVVSGA